MINVDVCRDKFVGYVLANGDLTPEVTYGSEYVIIQVESYSLKLSLKETQQLREKLNKLEDTLKSSQEKELIKKKADLATKIKTLQKQLEQLNAT